MTAGRMWPVLAWAVLAGLLSGCGFHLRGEGPPLPASLATLRIASPRGQPAPLSLLVELRQALEQRGATVVEGADAAAPTLMINFERVQQGVLAVDSQGRVLEYALSYDVGFQLLDAQGRPLGAPQSIHFERDYTFSQATVLATDQEAREIRRHLRRDAVAQIVRRLIRLAPAS